MGQTNIWWIRRDIRLHDNQTLHAALQGADHMVPLFIIEPALMANAAPKRRAFLLQALSDLDQQLKKLGSQLILRQGPAICAIQSLVQSQGVTKIFAHEDFSPFARQRDRNINEKYTLKLCESVVLRHPKTILKEDGDPYVVFTPYKNKWHQNPIPIPADCLAAPKILPPIPEGLETEPIPGVESIPGFPATAEIALQRLHVFTRENIQKYESHRNQLNLDGTSRLSPYLRFGLISPREAIAQAQIAYISAKDNQTRSEVRTWMDELVWREFYTAILYHFPRVMDGPFREDYRYIRWRDDAPQDLQAWQNGETGYPIVDACMRQLLTTGWMHNRGRMIVASFLTKDLLINWQAGEAWFMANLIDGDPAANNGGWQWSAGTGTDAAPYFRIFNPVLQGQKYDPDGQFIAKWVPELSKLPVKYRYEPWKIRSQEEKKYKFKPGKDYPERIINHKFARQRTLDAYKSARGR